MYFNSYVFVLAFFPVSVVIFHTMRRIGEDAVRISSIILSIVFYACVCGGYSLLVFSVSMMANYLIAVLMDLSGKGKLFLTIGVAFNIALLFWFKYYNFTVHSINGILSVNLSERNIDLPLGISFITFQQISYLVERRQNTLAKTSSSDYLAYITFYPKLLMGPLAEPGSFQSQFHKLCQEKTEYQDMVVGIQMFLLGLFKKFLLRIRLLKG